MSIECVLAEILTLILEACNTDILFPQIPLPLALLFSHLLSFLCMQQLCPALLLMLINSEREQEKPWGYLVPLEI